MTSAPLTIVTWKWKPTGQWSKRYTHIHVNALRRMLEKHLHIPHRLVCVTDDPAGVHCDTIPLWDEPVLRVPGYLPNCYKRLRAFAADMAPVFGPRFASIDLDVLITRDVTPILDRPTHDFMILRGHSCPYNGSLWMMNTGARARVWDDFDPATTPAAANSMKMQNGRLYYGSDQAVIAAALPDEKTWDHPDGIYQYVRDIRRHPPGAYPPDARMIFFAGRNKPWDETVARRHPALHDQWRTYAAEAEARYGR